MLNKNVCLSVCHLLEMVFALGTRKSRMFCPFLFLDLLRVSEQRLNSKSSFSISEKLPALQTQEKSSSNFFPSATVL